MIHSSSPVFNKGRSTRFLNRENSKKKRFLDRRAALSPGEHIIPSI